MICIFVLAQVTLDAAHMLKINKKTTMHQMNKLIYALVANNLVEFYHDYAQIKVHTNINVKYRMELIYFHAY